MSPKPFLGLAVIFRDNVDTLPKLLASIDKHFDFYSFVDTGAVDGSRALIDDFLKSRRGLVSDFEWIEDFAAARNAAFDQCPSRWKMFLDTDDELVNGDKIRPLLVQVESKNPQLEAFFVKYDYDHLEELPTLRIIKAREGWKWRDAIHERMEFTHPDGLVSQLPDSAFGRVSEFHVRHKPKSAEEKIRAIRRNARIAERDYALTTDVRYRARLARTIAMEMKMDGKAAESIPFQQELYQFYRTYPEGRQAAADISKAYQFLAEQTKDTKTKKPLLREALEWAQKAGPAYEGLIHHTTQNWTQVLKAAQRSLGRGQQATHEGFIFEKGAIYVAAASAAMNLKMDPAVAEKCLNYIPRELRNDKAILNHVSSLRHAIDRITIVVPGTPQPFDENGGGGMLGGSEEAVVYLTRALARLKRNVRVYGVLPPHRLPGVDRYGVDWQPIEKWNADEEQGTLVLWRAPGVLYQLMQQAQQRGGPPGGIVQGFLWLHDSGLGMPPEVAEAISGGCDGAVILSDFHAKMVRDAGYKGNLFKLSNGIVEDDFAPYIDKVPFDKARDPFKVVYSSCPSRGLVQLLEMWPKVKAAVPKATLDIYYDWSALESMQPQKFEQVSALYDSVKHLDVKHHGGVDHQTLHQALRRANVWAYSHFESPYVETSCISSMKALACGATVLTVPNGALPETTGGDAFLMTDPESYCQRLIDLLKNPETVKSRRAKAHRILSRYGWNTVAKGFSALWTVKSRIKLS